MQHRDNLKLEEGLQMRILFFLYFLGGDVVMTDYEKQIESIGYAVRVMDDNNNYIIYENKKEDQEVILEWDCEDQYCYILSQTISRKKDWFGHTCPEPMSLTIYETAIFTARLKELQERVFK